jgi:hypothetical protein
MADKYIKDLGLKTTRLDADWLIFQPEAEDSIAYRISVSDFLASVTTVLGQKVNITDIIDNLTTNVSDQPLSAAQGVALKSLIDGLSASLIPQGNWNASTNTPDIDATATTGQYWIVSVAGSTSLGGITDWGLNDWAVKDATGWSKIDNTDIVLSVQNETGNITITLEKLDEPVTGKTMPIDADTVPLYDSITSGFKKLTWANVKATLKTYFDNLYPLKANVLERDNTDVFTPDADYEPATKKYVDDNAGAADDTPYNATSWNTNQDPATKNAIRDKFVTIDSDIAELGISPKVIVDGNTITFTGASGTMTTDVDKDITTINGIAPRNSAFFSVIGTGSLTFANLTGLVEQGSLTKKGNRYDVVIINISETTTPAYLVYDIARGYDQLLNTTNDVEFAKATLSELLLSGNITQAVSTIGTWNKLMTNYVSDLSAGQRVQLAFGKDELSNNLAELTFYYGAWKDADSNYMTLGLYGSVGMYLYGNKNVRFENDVKVTGALTQKELSADPDDPFEGESVTWQSDGTGSGDDGDIMMKIRAGGVTKTVTLVDFSAV